jgi:bifunctional non-homologous end joining protein LigD
MGGARGRRVREPSSSGNASRAETEVAGVRITHPERVAYPELGVTKLDLARYYVAMGDEAVRHVAGRPLTLVRCPAGVGTSCFYMRHSQVWAPSALRRVDIREKTKTGEYLVADSVEALVSLVQMNAIEVHTWNSTTTHLECPDRVVIDIDPGPDVGWDAVVEAARLVRRLLGALDLASFVKTTGGRGLHVVVPLAPRAGWHDCLAFARGLADTIVRHEPARYTTEFRKSGRESKILVDYLRNNRTNTSIAAFSPRARPGAPVSVPVRWEELGPRLHPASFTVRTVPARIRRLRQDPWRDYWTCEQRLTPALVRAVS